jgi:hypothetical protein
MISVARVSAAVATAALLVSASAMAAGPQSAIVGQIVAMNGGVRVSHLGQTVEARPYQPLYGGDVVQVVSAAGSADVELANSGGAPIHVTRGSGPYSAPAGGRVDGGSMQQFLSSWSFVLSPPRRQTAVDTTPRSLEPESPLFPMAPAQRLRSNAHQMLAIAWAGGAAPVQLKDGSGAVLAKAPAGDKGFALVDCPGLAPGQYQLQIGETASSVSIPVTATTGPPEPDGASADERALKASATFDAAVSDRLQALADLQALSTHSFLAHAVIKAVRSGNYGPKAVAP